MLHFNLTEVRSKNEWPTMCDHHYYSQNSKIYEIVSLIRMLIKTTHQREIKTEYFFRNVYLWKCGVLSLRKWTSTISLVICTTAPTVWAMSMIVARMKYKTYCEIHFAHVVKSIKYHSGCCSWHTLFLFVSNEFRISSLNVGDMKQEQRVRTYTQLASRMEGSLMEWVQVCVISIART